LARFSKSPLTSMAIGRVKHQCPLSCETNSARRLSRLRTRFARKENPDRLV
jgi:hypothetical protein